MTDEERAEMSTLWGALISDIYGASRPRAEQARKTAAMLTYGEYAGGGLQHADPPREPSPYIAEPDVAEAKWRARVSGIEGHNAGCLVTLMDAALELGQHGDTERAGKDLRFVLASRHGIEVIPENAYERSRLAERIAHTGLLVAKADEKARAA